MANEDLRLSFGLDTSQAEKDIQRIAQQAAKAFSNIGVSSNVGNINFSKAEKSLNNFSNRASTQLKKAFSNAQIDDRKFIEPLGKVVRSVSEFDKSMEAANARVLAFGASTGVVLAVQRSFRSLVNTTVEVEKELKDINVVLNLSEQQLGSFKRSLFDVANNTGQTFATVAEGAKELSRQGLGATETIGRLNDAMILTRLSGLGAQESVEALTAAINSYTKSLLTSRDIVNTIATVDAAFAVSSADLAEGLKRVGSSAEDAGVSFEELIALITSTQQITNRGGTVIGNAFKTIFTRLNRPEVLDQLEGLGITVRKASGEILPATRILEQYANAADNLSPALRSNIDELIGSVFQINQLKALIKDLNSEYGIYSRALDIANDKTSEAILRNQELNTTLDASIKQAKNNIAQFSSNIGNELISGNFKNILDTLNFFLGSEAGESIGGTLGKGLFKGFADFAAGPGAVLALSALAGIVKGFVNFSKESFQSIQKTIFTKQGIVDISKETSKYLTIESDLYQDILSKNISIKDAGDAITKDINERTRALKEFKAINDAVVASISGSGKVINTGSGLIIKDKPTSKISNLAPSPLAQAVQREQMQTGLPLSKIKVGQDPRLISPENPTGLGVYNTRDEPLGISQGIEREKALGNDPKKSGLQVGKIPSFAPKVLTTQKPFTNSIGDLIGSQTNAALDNLTKAINKNENEMNILTKATRKFYKDIFTQGGLDKAYNNFADALNKAGIEQSRRTELSNEIHKKGQDTLKTYNENLKKLSEDYRKKTQKARDDFDIKKSKKIEQANIVNQRIKSAEELGRKGGILGFLGVNAIRADNQLKKIDTQEALLARRGIKNDFGSNNKALIASIAAPLIAGVANEVLSNTAFKENPNSTAARATNAGISGIANIAAFAGTGAALGGPVGAAGGALLGGFLTIGNIFSELTNTLPDLTDALRKTTAEITTINDSLSRVQQLRNDLNKEASPQARLEILTNLVKETATLRSKNIKFNSAGQATNAEEILGALNTQQLTESIVKSAKLFDNDKKNEVVQKDLLSLFSNLKFDGKNFAETLLSGSGNEKVVTELDKANQALKNNELAKNKLENTPLIRGSRSDVAQDAIKRERQFSEFKKNNNKILEDFFKNILPEDLFKGLKKNGGDDVFKLLFESLRNSAEVAKDFKENEEELNKTNQQTIKIIRELNNKFLALQNSIALASQLNSIRKSGRSSVDSLIQNSDKQFTNLAALSSNERSLLDFGFARDSLNIGRKLDNDLANNADNQSLSTRQSINDVLKNIDRDLLEIKGLKGFGEAFDKLEEFANSFDPNNAESQIKTLENDIINIIGKTNSGQTFGTGKNATTFDKIFQSISDINRDRLQNDEILKSEAEASRIALELSLDIQKKILAAQEKINFGGGISNLINGNNVQNIFDASQNSLFGDRRQRLQGNFQLAEIAQTLGLQQPLKEEIITGLTEEIKRVVNSIGGSISDTDARSIATTQFNSRFKNETPVETLTKNLENLQNNAVKQTEKIYKSLEDKITVLADTIKNNFALNLERALILKDRDGDAVSRARLSPNPPEFVQRLNDIDAELRKSSPQRNSGVIINSPQIEKLELTDHAKAIEEANIQVIKNIDASKANANSTKELNEQYLNTIKANRANTQSNRQLASSMAQANAQIRANLIQNGGISSGKAFADNLYDSLLTNNTELNTNIANSGLELGLEIKSAFKSSISAMIRDIDNFEDAAKQAFISILDKVTDIGVSNFVDQGLSAVTSAIGSRKKFNSGGIVQGGSGVRDDVPAVLQGGEFVVRKSVVDKLGPSFFEGLNSSSGSAAITLQNAFEANSTKPTKITDGQLNIDPSLSAFALSDSNNPQNQKRFDTESEFLRYIESLRDYEASIDQAMRAYKKQKRNIITQGFLSAFFNFAAFGLGKINAKGSKSANSSIDPAGELKLASGGMSKDTVPALLQGGEFVASKSAVDKFGVDFFERLNQGKINPRKFATGGFVQSNNTNFVQPTNNQSQSIDMSPVVNSINQLSNSLKENRSQVQQSLAPVNNISINVTVQKDGSVQTTQSGQSNNEQNNDKQTGQRLADLIRANVYEIIAKETRPNGVLYIPNAR